MLLKLLQRRPTDDRRDFWTRRFSPGRKGSANKDWLRALQRTAPIEQDRNRILPVAFDEVVASRGAALAVIDDRESLSFRNSPSARIAIPAGRWTINCKRAMWSPC